MKNVKIAQSRIVELGVANSANYDIKLQGTSALALVNEQTKEAAKKNIIDLTKSHFKENFDSEDGFFYAVSLIDDKYVNQLYEVGIGYLKDDGTTLHRAKPLYFATEDGQLHSNMNGPTEFFVDHDDCHIVVSNYIPSNLIELLVQPNSVIATSDTEFVPLMVHMDKQSILGRLDDDIENISIDDISQKSLDLIKSHTKQLILKSSRLDVKKIKTSQITLDPHRKPDAKRGTLFYNDKVNELQFFNGEGWRTLSCKDDGLDDARVINENT